MTYLGKKAAYFGIIILVLFAGCDAAAKDYIVIPKNYNITNNITNNVTGGPYHPHDQPVNTTDAVTFATVNTGQGANELYDMDQNVKKTSDVQFRDVTATGDLRVGDDVTFSQGINRLLFFLDTGLGFLWDEAQIGYLNSGKSHIYGKYHDFADNAFETTFEVDPENNRIKVFGSSFNSVESDLCTGNTCATVSEMLDDDPEQTEVHWSDLTDQGTHNDGEYCAYDSGSGYINCNETLTIPAGLWWNYTNWTTSNNSVLVNGSLNVTGNYQSLIDLYSAGHNFSITGDSNIALGVGDCFYRGDPVLDFVCDPPLNNYDKPGLLNITGYSNLAVLKMGHTSVPGKETVITGVANLVGGTHDVDSNYIYGNGNLVWGTGDFVVDDGSTGNINIGNNNQMISSTGGGAFGQLHYVSGNYCYAFGAQNNCSASYAFAGGYANNALAGTCVTLGRGNTCEGIYSGQLGYFNLVSSQQAFAFGRYVNISENQIIALGNGPNMNGRTNNDIKFYYENITIDKGLVDYTNRTSSLNNLPHVEVWNVTENGYTLTIGSLNTWYNFTGMIVGEKRNFTIDGGIIPTYGGSYKVDWSVSFSGSGGSTHAISLLIDGTEHTPCRSYRKLGSAGDVGSVSGNCIITVSAGANITGAVKDINAPANNVAIWSMNADFIRISD